MSGNFLKSSHCEQWILDRADLVRERSEDLKVYTEEEYQKVMIFFINLIQEIGRDPNIDKAPVHMQAISTACIYFRRFYARRSFRDIDPFLLAPTCLLLAAKVEESGILQPNKLINATNNVLKTKWPYLESFLLEVRWPHLRGSEQSIPNFITVLIKPQQLQEAEFYILETLDCSLVVYNPYRALTHLLKDKGEGKLDISDPLYNDAWKVCNDSLRSDCPLLFAPHIIAIAAIMIALATSNRDTPDIKWLSELSVDYEQVFEAQQLLFSMYKLWSGFNEQKQLESLLERLPKPLL